MHCLRPSLDRRQSTNRSCAILERISEYANFAAQDHARGFSGHCLIKIPLESENIPTTWEWSRQIEINGLHFWSSVDAYSRNDGLHYLIVLRSELSRQ